MKIDLVRYAYDNNLAGTYQKIANMLYTDFGKTPPAETMLLITYVVNELNNDIARFFKDSALKCDALAALGGAGSEWIEGKAAAYKQAADYIEHNTK